MSENILAIEDLTVRFHVDSGIVHAVNGVSYQIRTGETLGIVGESGCGKSVSMLAVMGLLPHPQAQVSGQILFQDMRLDKLPEAEMRTLRGNRIAMVFQDPMTSLNPLLSIGEQLTEQIREHAKSGKKEAAQRAIELLTMVGIPCADTRMGDYPHQFSGGMRQRAMIAMALSCNPDLLIADEPTTALDVTIQAQIIDLVKSLRQKLRMSLVWITHDLGVVAGLVDRLNVMYAGRIVESGKVESVYAQPLHPYTVGLLGSVPRLNSAIGEPLMTIKGSPPSLYTLPAGCPFASRCPSVQSICFERNPNLVERQSGHEVACWVDITTGKLLV